MPWFDGNDTLGAVQSMIPKDLGNLATGTSTYGIWEYVVFLDDLFYNAWMTAAGQGGMGLCLGLMATTLMTRLMFVPLGVYS
jgi:membrane protein insertase Oxa1/YidC/SpoIIIJ